MSVESTQDDEQVERGSDEGADAEAAVDEEELSLAQDEPEVVDVAHTSPALSRQIAVLASVVGAGLTTLFTTLAIPFGIAGVVITAGSLYRANSRGWLSVGVGSILVGSLITGAYGAVPAPQLLIGVSAAVVAWDVGQHGLSLGDQLGTNASTSRLELVHATTTMLTIGVIDLVAVGIFMVAGAGRPASAIALLMIGVVLIAWVFRS